ncbi:MAG: hypothetical protein PF590_04995 [Candidatus Delongbacteria bacterium]|jgi:hypothetical protein|nr:hypothetical protein [Candidatus Delongbacteria bacterium]
MKNRKTFSMTLGLIVLMIVSMTSGCKPHVVPSAPIVGTPVLFNTLTPTSTQTIEVDTATPTPSITVEDTPTVTCNLSPDLTITGLQYTVDPSITCSNGTQQTMGYLVTFTLLNVAPVYTSFVISVNGQTAMVPAGSYYMGVNYTQFVPVGWQSGSSATIDSTNVIAECNENNNYYSTYTGMPTQLPTCLTTISHTPTERPTTPIYTPTVTNTVGTCSNMPDLQILYVRGSTENPYNCYTGTHPPLGTLVTIVNYGMAPVTVPFDVSIVGYDTLTVNSGLVAGGNMDVWFPAIYTGMPTYYVDYGNDVVECIKNNNSVSISTNTFMTPTPLPTCVLTISVTTTPIPPTYSPTSTPTTFPIATPTICSYDLEIISAIIAPQNPALCYDGVSNPYVTMITYTNNGGYDVTQTFYIEAVGYNTGVTVTAGVAVGATDSAWIGQMITGAGTFKIDAYDAVYECDNANNTFGTVMYMATPISTCYIEPTPTQTPPCGPTTGGMTAQSCGG